MEEYSAKNMETKGQFVIVAECPAVGKYHHPIKYLSLEGHKESNFVGRL